MKLVVILYNMCSSIYLNSSSKLPLIDWVEKSPGFYLTEEKSGEVIKTLQTFFSVRNLYETGSHLGCGCGFLCDQNYSTEEDYKERIKSFNGLINYLRQYIHLDIQLFYTSWDEDVFNIKIENFDFKLPLENQNEMIFPENVLLNIME